MRIRQRRDPVTGRRRSRGQSLVEFALVIPIFITVVVAICEFSMLFSNYLSASFTSRDAVQVAAEMGTSPCTDEVVLARVEQDLSAPADKTKIQSVQIFWSDGTGNIKGGAVNLWKRQGSSSCTLPDTTVVTIPYILWSGSYPLANRCNIVSAAGCTAGHTTIDTIGVTITYQYTWITPLPGLIGLSGSGMTLVQTNVMRLEPVK